jgi:aminopeptidase N
VWTLSEPYGAKDWWPCKDHPLDKADSVDIWVTCSRDFKVASNGKLIGIVNNPDSTHTYKWAERYPIATYLVFVSLANYAEFTNWFRYSPTDSMPIVNYVLPENLADARDSLPKVIDMLRIYSDKFGLYPFINEKFGHAEFGRGGAMEHQTMTSLVRPAYAEFVLAHELGHQWLGDLITCANWPNVWLNEGFASYCEAIYAEGHYGRSYYAGCILDDMTMAKTGVGSIYRSDTTVIRQLFDQGTAYRKGSSVLHMLRHVLGDSVFFHCLKSYVADPRFRFGVATTEDFQTVCETVSGRSLGWFFTQWIYGEKYPRYSYGWQAVPDTDGGYLANITLQQTTGTNNPSFFTMPIDFKLSAAGWDTTVVLLNNVNLQQFRFWVSHQPTTIELDPENWISKDVTLPNSATSLNLLPTELKLEQNYPNPFNPLTNIKYQIPVT